jgi:RNA polymerase sigma-70 factor (ECF subfamily)
MTGLVRFGRMVSPEVERKRTQGSNPDKPSSMPSPEFDQLFAPHDSEIRIFVRRRVDAQAVDDVMQEIRLAAFASMVSFNQRSSFRTWLYGIALNKCRDYYRGRGKDAAIVSLDSAGSVQAAGDAHAASDLHHTVSQALAELSQSQREVLELYYYGELTLPEIATILNRNLNTVKYQFYRAHAELADRLGGKEEL